MCLGTWIIRTPSFSKLFSISGKSFHVQCTIVLKRKLFCCLYSTRSSGSKCLKSLGQCFVIVLLASCHSRSVRFPMLLLFSTKNCVFQDVSRVGVQIQARSCCDMGREFSFASLCLLVHCRRKRRRRLNVHSFSKNVLFKNNVLNRTCCWVNFHYRPV